VSAKSKSTSKKRSKRVIQTKIDKKASGRAKKTRKTRVANKVRPEESPKKRRKQAKGRPKSVKPVKPAEMAVELSIRVADGIISEVKRVMIAGIVRPPRSKTSHVFPGVKDREKLAKQVSRGIHPDGLARLLSAIAHPQRLAILLKLLSGEATHKLLAKTTGLKAGPLYYHLRELREAELIGPRVRDLYVLTRQGRRALMAVIAIERL